MSDIVKEKLKVITNKLSPEIEALPNLLIAITNGKTPMTIKYDVIEVIEWAYSCLEWLTPEYLWSAIDRYSEVVKYTSKAVSNISHDVKHDYFVNEWQMLALIQDDLLRLNQVLSSKVFKIKTKEVENASD